MARVNRRTFRNPISARATLSQTSKEKRIISGILDDIEAWCKDIKTAEFKASLALRNRSSKRRTAAEDEGPMDKDDSPIEKGDAVEMPGKEGETNPKDIGLVIEVNDKDDELISVEVADGKVIEVESKRVKKISDKEVARKIRFASLRRRTASKDRTKNVRSSVRRLIESKRAARRVSKQ